MIYLKRCFPQNSKKWSLYFKAMYPVILGTSLFALNGFIDNFMVGKYNGVASVSAVNSWTNIVLGIVLGIAAAAGITCAQLYARKNFVLLSQMARFRYVFTSFLVAIICILALIIPTQLIQIFLKKPGDAIEHDLYEKNMIMAQQYLKITLLQWLVFAVSGNLGNQLREIGYSRVTMYWGIASIFTNITLNALLIYGFDFGVEGAAWASVASRLVELTVGIIFVKIKKLPIGFKIWTLFAFNKQIVILFFRQFIMFFSFSSMVAIVNFRNYFYDLGFPQGSIGQGVGAAAVLGLTNAIMNTFTTSIFASTGVMAANFVGSQLGKGNIDQAKINSRELKGFNTSIAIVSSCLIVIIALLTPLMTFLVNVDDKRIDTNAQLSEVRNTLLVVAMFLPMWIWTSTSYRNSVSGGKSFWFSIGDWILNACQIGWAALVMGVIKDSSPILASNFWLTYIIFFTSDITKTIWQTVCYNVIDWAKPLRGLETSDLSETSRLQIERLKNDPIM